MTFKDIYRGLLLHYETLCQQHHNSFHFFTSMFTKTIIFQTDNVLGFSIITYLSLLYICDCIQPSIMQIYMQIACLIFTPAIEVFTNSPQYKNANIATLFQLFFRSELDQ